MTRAHEVIVHSRLALLLLVVPLLGVGCSRYRGQRSARQYAEQIERSNQRLGQLNRALSRFNERTRKASDAKIYLRDDVFPRFESYLSALKGVTSDNDELRGIHQFLVDEHARLFDVLKRFDTGLNDKNLGTRVVALKAAVRRTQTAQTDYQIRIRAFYAKYGLKTEK